MRDQRILLGNCEPLLNDYVEALFKELCYGRTVLQCIRASWLEEFERQACRIKFDLVMLIPNNLRQEGNQSASLSRSHDALRVLRAIKHRASTPVLAIMLADERAHDEPLLKAAGADALLGLPFDAEGFKSTVRRLLHFPRKPPPALARRWFCPQLPFYQNLEPAFSH